MYTLNVRNVHEALPKAIKLLREIGERQESRNGPVLVAPLPVATLYRQPCERVLFWGQRDSNPYFHFFESLWMLAGRNDVEFPAAFAKQLGAYSDDGKTIPGAYGYRWRHYFDHDQLEWVIARFMKDRNDRRVVLTMWDGYDDPYKADAGSADVPCNTQAYFRILDNPILGYPELCMQVNCRSNDIFWGAYGANAVHFSFLQEYLASMLRIGVGWYIQNSFNWHGYLDFIGKMERRPAENNTDDLFAAAGGGNIMNPYEAPSKQWPHVVAHSLVEQPTNFDNDLRDFLAFPASEVGWSNRFFQFTAQPLWNSHVAYKKGNFDDAEHFAGECASVDWRVACLDWLERRREASARKASAAVQADTSSAAG